MESHKSYYYKDTNAWYRSWLNSGLRWEQMAHGDAEMVKTIGLVVLAGIRMPEDLIIVTDNP